MRLVLARVLTCRWPEVPPKPLSNSLPSDLVALVVFGIVSVGCAGLMIRDGGAVEMPGWTVRGSGQARIYLLTSKVKLGDILAFDLAKGRRGLHRPTKFDSGG